MDNDEILVTTYIAALFHAADIAAKTEKTTNNRAEDAFYEAEAFMSVAKQKGFSLKTEGRD